MQRLRPSQDRRQGLVGGPDDVVLGLLRGQGHPAGLGMEPEHGALETARPEPVPDDPGPHPPGRPELRNLLEQVHVAGEEEGDPGGELVDGQPRVQGGLHVGDSVGKGERHLLHRGAAGLAHVVARDRDGVPQGQAIPAVGEQVGDQPHRGLRRVDVRAPGRVLLEDVVLDGAPQPPALDPLLLRHQLV